jgi:hypothetical protein
VIRTKSECRGESGVPAGAAARSDTTAGLATELKRTVPHRQRGRPLESRRPEPSADHQPRRRNGGVRRRRQFRQNRLSAVTERPPATCGHYDPLMRLRDAIEMFADSNVAALGPTTWADLGCGAGTSRSPRRPARPGHRHPHDGPRRLGPPGGPPAHNGVSIATPCYLFHTAFAACGRMFRFLRNTLSGSYFSLTFTRRSKFAP